MKLKEGKENKYTSVQDYRLMRYAGTQWSMVK